jgi:alkylation response protein AidB-like acyl-CoA dehydrogenase
MNHRRRPGLRCREIFADAAIAIHACRLMALDAAAGGRRRDIRTEASMIKVFTAEMASG